MEQTSSKLVATIQRVWLDVETDTDPDLSWLEADSGRYDDVSDQEERERYEREDAERLADFGGGWWMLGLVAKATVRISLAAHPDGWVTSFNVSSGGLWGVESDSGPALLTEIAEVEFQDLADELAAIGLELPESVEALTAEAVRREGWK